MKNVYIVVGGIVVAVVAFAAGMYFDRFSAAQNSLQGTIVAHDAVSISIKLSDGSVRSVPVGNGTTVFAQPEAGLADPSALVAGRKVLVNFDGDKAATIFMTVPLPAAAK
jgi:hypothetical protein